MAWSAPTAAKLLLRLTPQEVAGIKALQGGVDTTAEFVSSAVNEIRGYIEAGGYPVDQTNATTLPLALHEDCYAIARQNLAISIPAARIIQSEDRQKRFAQALKKCESIAAQRFAPEDPAPASPIEPAAGSWNSEQKILGRMHPVAPPSTQAEQSASDNPPYANPTAPSDN